VYDRHAVSAVLPSLDPEVHHISPHLPKSVVSALLLPVHFLSLGSDQGCEVAFAICRHVQAWVRAPNICESRGEADMTRFHVGNLVIWYGTASVLGCASVTVCFSDPREDQVNDSGL
jgi:hypothetical protein